VPHSRLQTGQRPLSTPREPGKLFSFHSRRPSFGYDEGEHADYSAKNVSMNATSANLVRFAARLLACGLLIAVVGQVAAQERVEFNRDVRPILSEHCFFCHGQDPQQRQAGLRLDQSDAAIEYGAIVPGEPENSLLVERITSDDPDWVMPPPDSHRALSRQQKETLIRWIRQGGTYETHWAFVAPRRPPLPDVRQTEWGRNPIDRFVLAKLEQSGLSPSPPADRATLIRRLSIDLTGLPPTIDEVDAFVSDSDPQAWEKLVDRLLASPHYGERLALPWLDAARYADSNGFQQDGDTWQWIWRDWVVQALNDDLPFEQFTIWQLAGDLLPNASVDQRIASGFNRNHMLNGEGGAIAEEQRFVNLFDRVDTTATTWLGLTMACAQCHDHKYDPVTQQDYYRLMDAFNRLPESGMPQRQSARIRVAAPFLELPTEEDRQRIAEWESRIAEAETAARQEWNVAFAGWRAGLEADGDIRDLPELSDELKAIPGTTAELASGQEPRDLNTTLRKYFDEQVKPKLKDRLPAVRQLEQLQRQLADYRGDRIPRVMIMSDDKPRQTHVLRRGEYLKPEEPVSFGTPDFLPPLPAGEPLNRLGLARWLVSAENPLTARVQVNRMWQYFFGTGIVATSEDLGVQSEYPVHRELLDWLAVEFRESGWSRKQMHRLIVCSATYRQSSRLTRQHLEKDPDNRLYARASRFRMPAMILRDWALAASGLLVDDVGGPPVYPYQPENVWEPLAITKERDFSYPFSTGRDLYRRSLYTFWRRTVSPANMFDSSNRQACRVRRSITSTPLHALTTLNDPSWVEAARMLAERALQRYDSLNDQLEFAFRRVLCRRPTADDRERLKVAFEKQHQIYAADPEAAHRLLTVGDSPADDTLNAVQHAALSSVCLAILNLDEALTRE
jgi:hypothetical protein